MMSIKKASGRFVMSSCMHNFTNPVVVQRQECSETVQLSLSIQGEKGGEGDEGYNKKEGKKNT